MKSAVEIAAGLAGLTAYVYILGGLVVWARLFASRLYSDNVIDALNNKSLLANGLKVVAFEIVAFGAFGGCAWLLWRGKSSLGSGGQNGDGPTGNSDDATRDQTISPQSPITINRGVVVIGWLILQGILVSFFWAAFLAAFSVPAYWSLIAGGAWILVGFVTADSDFFRVDENPLLIWIVGIPVVIAAVLFSAAAVGLSALILLALLRGSPALEKRLDDLDNRSLIVPVITASAAMSLMVLAFLATPPVTFDRVEILLQDGTKIEGGYVARSNDGVIVATCRQYKDDAERSKLPRLRVIPNDQIQRLILGGDRYAIDNGTRPSLLDLGVHLFSQDKVSELLPGWRPSVRGAQEVCVDTATGAS